MKYIILILLFVGVSILYRKLEDKRSKEETTENYDYIQKYLLGEQDDLAKNKKPILWIHVPYEYNSRNWASFGSRSSMDLNQPYLYLTVKSIIQKCEENFHICIIDDESFSKLLPTWQIDMTKISSPILDNIRTLGLMKILYNYGGLLCPISFLCMRDLSTLYNRGINNGKMFLCETANHNVTSSNYRYFPSVLFSGCEKENKTMSELIDFIQRNISSDYTACSSFLGDFDRWCEKRIQNKEINMINGQEIGIKDIDENPIQVEQLLSQQYLKLYQNTYGILIPSNDILKRRKYEWFSRLSKNQVLESDTIIGKYLLLSLVPEDEVGIIREARIKPSWVSFWKVPSNAPLYGLKPNFLGDDLLKVM